jgi:hypothetical protein
MVRSTKKVSSLDDKQDSGDMTPKQELLRQWMEPLADNPEQQYQAYGLLDESIDEQADSLPQASALMRSVTPVSRARRHKGFVLFTITALLLVAFMGFRGWRWWEDVTTFLHYNPFDAPAFPLKTQTPQEEFLLYGDQNRTGMAAPWKALWEIDPHNVVFFADYVRNYAMMARELPPGALEIAEKLDPQNGWYLLLAAEIGAGSVVDDGNIVHPRSPVTDAQIEATPWHERRGLYHHVVYQRSINDRAKAKIIMDLWRKSLEKERYESHQSAMHHMRVNILNRRTCWNDQYSPIYYLASVKRTTAASQLLTKLIIASLQEADFSTPEGQLLFRDATMFTERIARVDAMGLMDLHVRKPLLLLMYQQILVIDTSHLDPALVALWRERYASLTALEQHLQKFDIFPVDGTKEHGYLLADEHLVSPARFTNRPVSLDIARLTPMRYADHCVVLKGLCAAGCVLCFLMIPYHLLGKRNAFLHRVSYEVWQAIPTRDLFRLVLLTVVAPLLYYGLLTFATDLTGKEWAVDYGYLFPWVPAISVFLLILLLTRLLAVRCFLPWERLRANPRGVYHYCGWAAVVLLLVPLHGMTFLLPWLKEDLTIVILLGIFWLPALLWLLAGAITRIGIGDFYDRMMNGVRCRVVGVTTASVIMVLVLAFGALRGVEAYWVNQDKVTTIDPYLMCSVYEAEILRGAQQDVLEAMQLTESEK